MSSKSLTVLELTRILQELFDEVLPPFEVKGEISNYRPHYSGHAFFTLKDDHAQLNAVMWRSQFQNLSFRFLLR